MVRRVLARAALLLHLLCLHVALFRLWYASGLRKMFTKRENVHVKDLLLAIRLADGRGVVDSNITPPAMPPEAAHGRLALLFMLRWRLEHFEAWRLWLEPEVRRSSPRVYLYFHLADWGRSTVPEADLHASAAKLRSLPGFRKIIPTVATGWCELMAAEVALHKAALLDDTFAELFVLLPHDAAPLVPLETTLGALVSHRSRSRVCLAGVRGMEVPLECPHAIEPHWSRSLLLKHHQWTALTRDHAARLADVGAMRLAVSVFQEWFLGEPLCSDEVLPLLALGAPERLLASVASGAPHSRSAAPHLRELPLYVGATHGIRALDDELRNLGVAPECITYAPWPGCHLRSMGIGKRTKSPVVGGGLAPEERDRLIGELVGRGVLFGRKLGLGGDSPERHMALIQEAAASQTSRVAPPRLMPDPDLEPSITSQLRWSLSTVEARLPLPTQVMIAAGVGALAGCAAVAGEGISRKWMQRLLLVYIAGHFVVFFFSVALFEEYSLLQPFRSGCD
eukprot:CAMPEP_0176121218 /NCGR_PEP_ID=MMETSP0120_2-20121206/61004_1 /TAXON_ID=160619 /ORGANISM="Kryptoperidinium foliaceum, Strain CCMP 1326" /LENGTH=508 /DNA_ID=CAMNT_0017455741 /DNA_START=10 /DNA_END=1533 /DNA_ORIENTATION=-